ncbi:MAG: hypothetical protein RIQ99_1076 [Pseudomonadota bacterium]|jgi:hypothetical protein
MTGDNFDYTNPGQRPDANAGAGGALGHGTAPTLSIFADRACLQGELRDDARDAGFTIIRIAPFTALTGDDPIPLGDIAVVDCPVVDAAALAALARLDLQACEGRVQLVVSTTVGALDDVFGCLDQSNPQILIDPTRADRVIALGYALAAAAAHQHLRELSDEDRLVMLRLAEQVAQIAQRLDRFGGGAPAGGYAPDDEDGLFRFESPRPAFAAAVDSGSERLVRTSRPALPDPRLVRRMIQHRQLRSRYFDGELFADPAWDMTSKIFEKSICANAMH